MSADHNDRPIQMRFNTFDKPAEVRISLPANLNFAPIVISIPSQSLELVDLTPFIETLEVKPENSVLNNGLHIQSNTCITAYYEIDAWNNPDIFILKGKNALGTKFLIPFQDQWSNDLFNTPARSGFDMVATENNTRVIITTTSDAVGHRANRPFEIFLDRGQTYSVVADSRFAKDKMIGSLVTSDKPIAITIKDDSQLNNDGGSCADIGGDQLVPVSIIGTKYIIPKGRLNTADQVIILATENNTQVNLNGNTSADFLLNQGQHEKVRLTDDVLFIESNHPIYVLHASGVNCEVGHAIVPHLECTGSKEISTARVDNGQFFIFIIVPSGHEANFLVSGVDFIINPSSFISVPGNPSFSVARISANFIPLDTPFRVSNTTSGFHFGILNGDTGARYGYFSDFGSLQVSVSDDMICQGDFVDISVKSTYTNLEWSPAINTSELDFSLSPLETISYRLVASDNATCRDTSDFTIQVNRSYVYFDTINACVNDNIVLGNQRITESGEYVVGLQATNGCDSILNFQVNMLDTILSDETVILCPGETLTLFGNQEVSVEGLYFNSYVAQAGCDSIHIIQVISDNTLYNLDTTYLCEGSSILLYGDQVSEPGLYSQTYSTTRSCDSLDETIVIPSVQYNLLDTVFLCEGSEIILLDQSINARGLYSTQYSSIFGCDSTQSYFVEIDAPDIYLNWPENMTISFGDTMQWLFSSEYEQIDSIQWNTLLGINCSTCSVWELYPLETTTYQLIVYTKGGCIIENSFTIEVNEKKPVYFPNAFSPNNDGLNDFFNGFTAEVGSIIKELKIYDRWGNLVYYQKDILPNEISLGWNGNYGNKMALPAVYIYQAKVAFVEGNEFIYTGDVALIR